MDLNVSSIIEKDHNAYEIFPGNFSNFISRQSDVGSTPMFTPSTNNVSKTADIHMAVKFNTVLSYNAFLSSQMHDKIWNYQDFSLIAYPDAAGLKAEKNDVYVLTDNAALLFHYVCHKNSPWRAKNLISKRNDYARICVSKIERALPDVVGDDGGVSQSGTSFLTTNGFILMAMEFNEYLRPRGGGSQAAITADQIVGKLGPNNYLLQAFGASGVRSLWQAFLKVGAACAVSMDHIKNPAIPYSCLVNQETQFATFLWIAGVLCRRKDWVMRAINSFLTFEQCLLGAGAFAYVGKQDDCPNYHYIIMRLYFILDYLLSSPATHKTLRSVLSNGKAAANRELLNNLTASGHPSVSVPTRPQAMSRDEFTARRFFLGPILQNVFYYPTTLHCQGFSSEYHSSPSWKHYWALAEYFGVRYATTFLIGYHTRDVYNITLSQTSFPYIAFENSLLYPVLPVVATDKMIRYVTNYVNPMAKANLGYYGLNFIKPYANRIRAREIKLMGKYYTGIISDFIGYDINIDGVRTRTPVSEITFVLRDPSDFRWSPAVTTKAFPMAGLGTQTLTGFMSLTHERQNRWQINGALDSICFGYMIPIAQTKMESNFPDFFRWCYISRNANIRGGPNILAPTCASIAVTHDISAKVKVEGTEWPRSAFEASQVWISLPAKGYASSATAAHSLAQPADAASSLSTLMGVFCVRVLEETCVHDARLFLNFVSARSGWGIPKFVAKVATDASDPSTPTFVYAYADMHVCVRILRAPKSILSLPQPHAYHDIEDPRPQPAAARVTNAAALLTNAEAQESSSASDTAPREKEKVEAVLCAACSSAESLGAAKPKESKEERELATIEYPDIVLSASGLTNEKVNRGMSVDASGKEEKGGTIQYPIISALQDFGLPLPSGAPLEGENERSCQQSASGSSPAMESTRELRAVRDGGNAPEGFTSAAAPSSTGTVIPNFKMVQQLDKFYTWGVETGEPKKAQSFSLGLRHIDYDQNVVQSRSSFSLPSHSDFTFIFQVHVVKDEAENSTRAFTKAAYFPSLKFRQPQPGLILLSSNACIILFHTGQVSGAINIAGEVSVSDADSWMSSNDTHHAVRSTAVKNTFPSHISPHEHLTILRGSVGHWLDCNKHIFPSVPLK